MQLAESARIGAAVLGVLHSQRHSLQSASDRQREAHDDLSETSTIMQRMWRRATIKRAVYISVAVLLLITIVVVLWLKYGGGSSSSSSKDHASSPP